MTIKLWHCHNTRSLRVLWALEEMQLPYELHCLPFPPRVLAKEYLALNPLGTVPLLIDDNTNLTESSAMLLYLVEHYNQGHFGVENSNKNYGDYLNWLFQSDATLTFPQTLLLRYSQFEPKNRQNSQIVQDYKIWFLSRLKMVNQRLIEQEYLVNNRFTIADIAVGYALYLGELLGLASNYQPQTLTYLQRLKSRSAFQRCVKLGADIANYSITPLEK
ncbi:glutathione S-transferase family protein [Thalassotalea profundi]|uniref:Glutathione S-transferase n=1 Tax=Thalassotalea profundi TaxID=2036687 RepID=A0ABQ3IFR9_9GAMM|nr:glutathione S-transferase family protein [Thalassotalea profundi]GHE81906.1 glutathione S-transferase [Thalassotalea profundi]